MPSAVADAKAQVLHLLDAWPVSPPGLVPLFRAFVQDALERLRGPFLSHHPPRRALQLLDEAFRFALTAPGSRPRVAVRPRSSGFAVLTHLVDQAFIVDTVRLFLRNREASWETGFNVVFHAVRDASGTLVAIDASAGQRESLLLAEAHGGTVASEPEAAAAQLDGQLTVAMAMVADFRAMIATMEALAAASEALATPQGTETADFLRWLLRENFVLMGISGPSGSLGTERLDGWGGHADGAWPAAHPSGLVRVRKSQTESPVHRAGRIDEIRLDLPGSAPVFLRGLFTYRAITQASRTIPVLRRVLDRALADAGALPGSHRAKGLSNVFDSLPTEYLLTTPQSGLLHILDLVFEAEQAGDVGATFHRFDDGNALCLVALPRSAWGDDLRRDIQHLVTAAMRARYCDHGVFVGRFDTVLLHFYLTGIQWPTDEALIDLGRVIRARASAWSTRLWSVLNAMLGEDEADRLGESYSRAFPDAWQRTETPERTAADLPIIDAMGQGTRTIDADLRDNGDGTLELSLYEARDVTLSDLLPVLDAFGLVILESRAAVAHPTAGTLHVDRFRIQRAHGASLDEVLARRTLLLDALQAVFDGRVESDGLNGLVLRAGLSWLEVDVLRAYCRYVRQHQVKVLVARVREILLSHPATCRALVALFTARFDPDLPADRATAVRFATEACRDALRSIRGYDEDLVFSALFELIDSTIRTNAWRTDRVSHYLSFKFDCARAARLMGPRRPMFEIYVHSPDVEGVHLRFGKVARGGLRWSDREDYRTEVLSLVTTQLVKNVVIVPTGSKGGFLLKAPSPDPKVRRQQADTHYKTFIRGLLDLTDNAVDGKPIRPPRVVCHDEADPYLVVAADKGTAHLSDTANALSRAYGFWLDDAFASGGSNGYDHKKVGITARGGWVLVDRHFAEMGRDPYQEPFTVVGVGDLSGDVFGNGLIETPHARLLAAFNHLHVFLDPDPDAARTAVERRRLFDIAGGWDKYDTSLLSKGGGIYERSARRIPLSPEVQAMLGITAEEAEPDVVIHHILKMDVDLLWNGGIGTYVKASDETHAQADDRTNDAVRVDATQLRARIVGEGGNLGFTQRARIEAGLRGARLNTDAIDNSGGVDLSDHEVNLKILLGGVVARGALDAASRNQLLADLTDEVAGLVLADNDVQGRQISRDELRSRRNPFAFGRAIDFVEQHMGQSRDVLRLPTDAELQRRASRGEGLTRPELAVLSAWVKMYVFARLLEADAAALPGYDDNLLNYFPASVRERYPAEIRSHMLANEIAMTVATTQLVGDFGAAFFPNTLEATGRSCMQVAIAALGAERLAGLDALRPALEAKLRGPSLQAAYEAWNSATDAIADVARASLTGRAPTLAAGAALDVAADALSRCRSSDEVARDAADDAALTRAAGQSVAAAVRRIRALGPACRLVAEATAAREPVGPYALHRTAVGRATRLGELLDALHRRSGAGRWDPLALGILHRRFDAVLQELAAATPATRHANVDEAETALRAGPLANVRTHVDAVLADPVPSLAALLVLEERLGAAPRGEPQPHP